MKVVNKNFLRKLAIYGAVFMIIAGSLLHFTYAWSGKLALIGLLSPVNESVWEHSKLFIVPLFIVGVIEYHTFKDMDKILWIKLVQFCVMSIFITAFFYTYTGALGLNEILIIDILSFIMAVIIGQYISYRMMRAHKKAPISKYLSGILLLLIFIVFSYTTFYPPSYPIFKTDDLVEQQGL